MPGQKSNNIKLGLFVLAGVLLLVFALYMLGKNKNLFGSNFQLKARFTNISGLTKGNNIRFSGIQVGTVKNIQVIDDTTIEVVMLIDEKIKSFLHKNAVASIGSEGLMGNKIINILPGPGAAKEVDENDVLSVKKTINTDDMLQTLNKTNDNVAVISEDLKSVVQRINNSAALWGVLNERSLAANLKVSLNNIRLASENTKDMTAGLYSIINDIKNGKGSVGALLTDTTLSYNLNEAIAKIKSVGDNANGLANELDEMARNVQYDISNGKGTVNALLKDSMIVIKLNASLDNIQKGTYSFSQDMEALKHNFLLRGYFRRQEKNQKKEMEKMKQATADKKD